jgi:prepilin-type N-terminal cleavage/methylation domain-containing protein
MRDRIRLRDRTRGFTLVEVLITIVVAGVLGGALMALVMGQQRFYGHSDDTIVAQQNLRAAMDLMATELRMASPTDIMRARSDSVVVRFDILRAVVCDVTGPNETAVFVYDSVTSANLPSGFRGTAYSGAYDSAFVYADGFTPAVAGTGGGGSGPQGVCTANGAPGGQPSSVYRRTTGWTSQFGLVPDRGSLLRWYGALAYSFGSSTSTTGEALFRNVDELVTPFEAGAVFRYVMANGSVQNNVAGGQLANIRQIRVVATAIGDGVNQFGVRRQLTYDIPLRN